MKGVSFFVCLTLIFFCTQTSYAQTFSAEKDTSKTWWLGYGTLDNHLKVKNETSSVIQLNWIIKDFYMDSKWKFEGGCDNLGCYPYNVNINITDTISAGKTLDFKFSFNGDSAVFETKAYATIEVSLGSYKKNLTFISYKKTGPTNIVNDILDEDDMIIFPNPSQDYIEVICSPGSRAKKVVLYNMIGLIAGQFNVIDKLKTYCPFNEQMPSGNYIVQIIDDQGRVLKNQLITRL
jgi:hypothetical protein